MSIRNLERQLEYLDQDIARLKQEGLYLIDPGYWVDTYCHSQTGKRYYRRAWGSGDKRGSETISRVEYEVLREQIYRGRKLARLQRKRDRLCAEIERVKEFADRYGLSLPSA